MVQVVNVKSGLKVDAVAWNNPSFEDVASLIEALPITSWGLTENGDNISSLTINVRDFTLFPTTFGELNITLMIPLETDARLSISGKAQNGKTHYNVRSEFVDDNFSNKVRKTYEDILQKILHS